MLNEKMIDVTENIVSRTPREGDVLVFDGGRRLLVILSKKDFGFFRGQYVHTYERVQISGVEWIIHRSFNIPEDRGLYETTIAATYRPEGLLGKSGFEEAIKRLTNAGI